MKTHIQKLTLLIVLITSLSSFADTHIFEGRITTDTTWTRAKSPYIIDRSISVKEGVEITIENGAKIIFDGGNLFLNHATLAGTGFEIESKSTNSYNPLIQGVHSVVSLSSVEVSGQARPILSAWDHSDIHIQSMQTDLVGDMQNVTAIQVYTHSKLEVSDSTFLRFGKALDIFASSLATVTDSVFSHNQKAVYTFNSDVFLFANDFTYNKIAVEFFVSPTESGLVYAEWNWWGSPERPRAYEYASDMAESDMNVILGDVTYDPWSLEAHKKPKVGNVSNVLFLPGLMGSRLYQKGKFENQLWEPNRNQDVKKLFLDSTGKSIEKHIYTRDVLAQTNIAGGISAIEETPYKDFFTYMDGLVKKGVINAWKPAPYDWRYSPDTLLENGISVGDTQGQIFTNSLVAEILLLAKTSQTKKVTIVTHSNGGLVAKQLMIELQKQHLDTLVEKIIFVAMPEYGTPQAITSLLYGHEQSIAGGMILSAVTAQQLGINMPTSYILLPSKKYFDAGKQISFATSTVADKNALYIKLTEKVNINNSLLHKADQFHEVVDTWMAPPYIPTYQIVGTGLSTVSGLMETASGKPLPVYTSTGDGIVQDMYDKTAHTYARSGVSFTVDLHNTKYKHMNIMNHTGTMKYIDNLIRSTTIYQGDFEPHPLYTDDYTLIMLAPTFLESGLTNKSLETITIGGKDSLQYSNSSQFNLSNSPDSSSRYDLFGPGIQYITPNTIQGLDIRTIQGDTFDINIFNKNNTGLTETSFEHVQVFQDGALSVEGLDTNILRNESIQILLPVTNMKVDILPTKEVVYDQNHAVVSETLLATSTEDFPTKIARIQQDIQASKISSYMKSRYISRLKTVLKSKDPKTLIALQEATVRAIKSIDSFAHSPALKGRYSKLRQEYIYLSYILK